MYKNLHIEPLCYVRLSSVLLPSFYQFWLLSCTGWLYSKSEQMPSTGFGVITS